MLGDPQMIHAFAAGAQGPDWETLFLELQQKLYY